MTWHTEVRKISELKNWESNPRTISEESYKELKKSIGDLGNFEPLVINVDGTVLAGNQRLRVHKENGDTEVEVSVPERELTEQEIRKIGLISNRHSGEWDMDKLANEFEDVLEELGFDDLLPEVELDVKEDDYEEPEDLEIRVKLGEIWQLGKHRLMCGDSTKIEDVERLMNGQKADMVFTDPPYGINYSAEKMHIPNAQRFEVIKNDDGDVKELIGACFTFDCPKVIWGANNFFKHLPHCGVWYAWDKRSDGIEDDKLADSVIGSQFELAWLDKSNGYQKIFRVKHGGFVNADGGKRVHPTQKPTRLIVKILDSEKVEGNIIDLFGGSGSTLIACEQTNRVCYMMELDEHYCTVILDRWEKLTGEQGVKLED